MMLYDPSSFTPANAKGLALALTSCLFIGSSFIMKKKGLKKAGALSLSAGRPLSSSLTSKTETL